MLVVMRGASLQEPKSVAQRVAAPAAWPPHVNASSAFAERVAAQRVSAPPGWPPHVNASTAFLKRVAEVAAARAKTRRAQPWWGGLKPGVREGVLVLSPVRSTNARRMARFARLLLGLRWPRRDLHVALLVSPDSTQACETTFETLQSAAPPLGSVLLVPEPESLSSLNAGKQDAAARHALENQRGRREAIARARNHLCAVALGRTHADWVLWLDNDLLDYPSDLILRLRRADVDMAVPTCYCSGKDACGSGVYDRNSWAETPASAARLGKLADDVLVVNGYGDRREADIVSFARSGGRRYLDDLRRDADAPLVPLDGVGATCILLRADLHRQGLVFPPFPLNHAIESEGLAQMAKRMGAGVFGLTDLAIRHA